jgi:hypothetical protein
MIPLAFSWDIQMRADTENFWKPRMLKILRRYYKTLERNVRICAPLREHWESELEKVSGEISRLETS